MLRQMFQHDGCLDSRNLVRAKHLMHGQWGFSLWDQSRASRNWAGGGGGRGRRKKKKKEKKKMKPCNVYTIRSSELALLLLSPSCPTCYCSHGESMGTSLPRYAHPDVSNSSLQTNPKTIWSPSRKWDRAQPVPSSLQNWARIKRSIYFRWSNKESIALIERSSSKFWLCGLWCLVCGLRAFYPWAMWG